MAKIPFTLDAWIKDKSQKVVDQDGRPVRIICTDADGLYPIIGLVDNKTPLPCGKNGRPPYIGGGDGSLFLVTQEQELSEFEKEYIRLYKEGYTDGQAGSKPISDDNLKECAAELLALAREELFANDAVLKEYAQVSREQGKAAALKDLPRWNESRGIYRDGWINDGFLYYKNHSIQLSSLEKLPGFKED